MSRVVLPADPRSASAARRFVRDVLTEWGETAAVDVVELLISELVTNAVLHAGSQVDVSLQRRARLLRVAVADSSTSRPVERQHDQASTTGRGMEVIDALAIGLGCGTKRQRGQGDLVRVAAEHTESRGDENEPETRPRRRPVLKAALTFGSSGLLLSCSSRWKSTSTRRYASTA